VPEQQLHLEWKRIRDKTGPYPPQAYQFVRAGLAHTVTTIHGDDALDVTEDQSRHVSGQQLCLGLRDYAIDQYGQLARTVLGRWGIMKTDDFGKIVFAMVEAGFMRTTDQDDLEDFESVFEFDEAFTAVESV